MSGEWLDLLGPADAPWLLVAIPYAGGAGRAFRAWRHVLPGDCTLATVDLPGHGARSAEPCLTSSDDVVDGLAEALAGYRDRALVLLGYSLGGWLAFALAQRFGTEGAPPAGLIACMSRAPHTGLGHPPVSHQPEGEEFLAEAVALNLAAPQMLTEPALARTFGTALHADLRIVETFQFQPGPPLPVPGAVIGARSDWLVPEPALRAWSRHFTRPPTQRRVDGGHLVLHERGNTLGAAVAAALVDIRHTQARHAN